MFAIKPRYTPLLALILLSGLLISPRAYADHRPLTFGFIPSRSAITLFKHYAPLRDYLSQQLKHSVILETAADYPTFILNTKKRKYDFVLTAPHFALLAIDSGKYDAPVTYTKALMADILVLNNSKLTHVNQLAGKKVSTPPQSAIISMAGKHLLNQHGLSGSRAPQYVVTQTHNASIHAMLAGDSVAAVVSFNITRQFLKKHAPIRKIATTGALPGMAFLVARDLPKQLRVSFASALVEMSNKPRGKAALDKMGYPGYRKTKANEFEAARPFLNMYQGSSTTSRD